MDVGALANFEKQVELFGEKRIVEVRP